MNRFVRAATGIAALWAAISTATLGQQFPDPALEMAIRDALGQPSGDLSLVQLETLTTLEANDRDIQDLQGIQYCSSLTVILSLIHI